MITRPGMGQVHLKVLKSSTNTLKIYVSTSTNGFIGKVLKYNASTFESA